MHWERDNKAWTYLNGHDKGGWDPTQVLRAPRSFNHKHEDPPRVRLVEENLTNYELAGLAQAATEKPLCIHSGQQL